MASEHSRILWAEAGDQVTITTERMTRVISKRLLWNHVTRWVIARIIANSTQTSSIIYTSKFNAIELVLHIPNA
jgi:hypothetical protein